MGINMNANFGKANLAEFTKSQIEGNKKLDDSLQPDEPKVKPQYQFGNTADLKAKGKHGDFCLGVNEDGQYAVFYINSEGQMHMHSISQEQWNNMKDYNGGFYGL